MTKEGVSCVSWPAPKEDNFEADWRAAFSCVGEIDRRSQRYLRNVFWSPRRIETHTACPLKSHRPTRRDCTPRIRSSLVRLTGQRAAVRRPFYLGIGPFACCRSSLPGLSGPELPCRNSRRQETITRDIYRAVSLSARALPRRIAGGTMRGSVIHNNLFRVFTEKRSREAGGVAGPEKDGFHRRKRT